MNVTPIHNPLPGEAALEVVPKLAREVGDADWRRRINLFTGRALSDVALRLEQQERAGRLATLSQSVSHGVVAGLEASVAVGTHADGELFHALMISPGLGLAASGEDLMIARPLSMNLRDVPVHTSDAPVAGDTLGALLDQGPLPLAGVLVLEPIVADLVGAGDSADPCERDPQNDPFDDWQSVDGCRVVYVAWPQAWQPLPVDGDQWRNRIAYTIFDEEMKYGPDEVLPWEGVGVPIALAAFGPASGANAIAPWAPLFLDRFSVVRAGGKPRRRSRLVPASGNAFLFQARVQQFAEQLADLGLQSTLMSEAAAQFRYLPPFGLLPRQAADPRDGKSRFFPSTYYVDAIPVPSEQLDAVLRATASLARFDTGTPDRVRLLVPVPQTLYEPRLLEIEIIDPSFQTALTEALTRRGEWLQRREDVRGKSKTIVKAIAGAAPEYPPLDQDRDALEHPEQVGTAALDPPEDAYQTEGAVATPYDKFLRELMGGPPWSVRETVAPLAVLAEAIVLPDALPPAFKGRIRYDGAQLVVDGVLGDADVALLQGIAGADAAWNAAITQLHTQSLAAFNATPEIRELNERGIQGFIPFLDNMIRQADDRIDFGFLNVHTNIYRIRQVMLGSQEATRLATSPIVAEIAKGETAVATRVDLQTFFDAARKTTVPEAKDFKGGLDFVEKIRGIQPRQFAAALGDAVMAAAPGDGVLAAAPAVSLARAVGGLGGLSLDTTVIARDTVRRDPVLEAKSPGATSLFETISAEGLQVSKPLTLIDAVRAKATAGSILAKESALPSAGHITQAPPIVGETYDFRTTTVTDRLKQPRSLEAKSFSVVGKFEVLSGLKGMDIQLGDIPVKGAGDTKFGNLTPAKLNAVLNGDHDPHPANGDEADFLGAGIKALDDAVTTMRAVEGRIQQYRITRDKASAALDALRDAAAQIDRRLKVIGDELAEARHDVSVTRALLAEETARVQGINDRRDRVIAQHARFLAYMRPRLIDTSEAAPAHVLNPGLTEAPVPVCLSQPVPVPPELRAMVDLLRESPVRWFTHIAPAMDRLDRLDVLHGALASAKVRANFITAGAVANVVGINAGGVLGTALMKAFTAQQTMVAQRRLQTAELDLSAFAGQSWKHSRDQAQHILSLGDLIDGQHGQTDVSRQASLELEQITRVAACFYGRIDDVLPRIRLEWAERLSQYDEPVNLHNLGNLPRWGEIEFTERREMQALTDWLYQRVDPLQPEAVGLINDIVRVAILLASHAPVNQIVAGHVSKPATVTPGSKIELSVDLTKIRVGMHALVYDKEHVVARAVVRDLASGIAAAHVIETFRPNVSLDAGARVHFTAPESFAISAGAKRAVLGKR